MTILDEIWRHFLVYKISRYLNTVLRMSNIRMSFLPVIFKIKGFQIKPANVKSFCTNPRLCLIFFRWNFVIHGCIDGFSRYVNVLNVCTNNLARTAFNLFKDALIDFGIPSKIRVDGGGEFNFHEKFMNTIDGSTRCLRGKSVHNVRIERHWRDCREKVLDKYITTFTYMENHNILDIANDIHLFALHFVFQQRIMNDLKIWQKAHNSHPIRTEKNLTPYQLWLGGSISNQHQQTTAMENIFSKSSDVRKEAVEAFIQSQDWTEPSNIAHVLSCVPAPLTEAEFQALKEATDVLAPSQTNGIDIYATVVRFIQHCIS